MAASTTRIRWDRIGRIALLFIAAGVLYLYIGPTHSWLVTYKESKQRKSELAALRHDHARLVARRNSLRNPATLEAEARKLGMVRGGEKAYVITGLPNR